MIFDFRFSIFAGDMAGKLFSAIGNPQSAIRY
jgi:hypothetical protein